MYKSCEKGVFAYVIMALAFIAVAFFKIPVIYCIIGCAVIGLVYSFLAKGKAAK
jgi:hypothetical protein